MYLDLLGVLGAVVPLYVAIALAFLSVRYLNLFTREECTGINKFVGNFAVPSLVLDLLVSNNPYSMNFRALGADVLQKIVIIVPLLIWKSFSKNGSFDWVITLLGLSTLSNTLLIGLPLVQSMYGDESSNLLIQLVVLQSLVWFNVFLAMYEYRAAKILIAEKFPHTAGSIASMRVDPEVASLSGREQLETDAEIGADGKLHVLVRAFSAPPRVSLGTIYGSTQSRVSIGTIPEAAVQSESNLNEINSTKARHSLSLKRGGSTKSYGRQGSNGSRVADETSFEIDVITENNSEVFSENKSVVENLDEGKKEGPPASVVTKLIIVTVWRKLIRNPTTYASIVGLTWSLIAFRYNLKLPLIIKGSITIISKTGVGMAMFSLGLFIASQPKIISIKISMMIKCIVVRLIVGPLVMAATSAAVGLHGVVFDTATVQAALPLSIVCFVFAKQYDVHPEIFSTTIITTTALFLPVTIIIYLILKVISW